MVSDVAASSSYGAAASLQLAQTRQALGVQALSQQAKQDGGVAELVAGAGNSLSSGNTGSSANGGSSGGGNVTATRGQNLNIVV